MKTYRSLSIGNSFSQDALQYCHDIAAADGIEWETVNLVVGGCELHRHWQYWTENDPHYALEINVGNCTGRIPVYYCLYHSRL